ncbi:Uncharacterized protein Rs2_05613 [Raphanus sativus]|nr:Uncharacterized protein Rs2_05613 [Raphanus sativus]
MGQDYSYSQPSSSDVDMDSLLLEEAELYADEAQSSYNAEPVQYEPDPEADDGIPTRCYCGGEPEEVQTVQTRVYDLTRVEVTDGQVTGYQVTGYQVTGYHQVTGVGSVVA